MSVYIVIGAIEKIWIKYGKEKYIWSDERDGTGETYRGSRYGRGNGGDESLFIGVDGWRTGLPKELAERLRELANQESEHAGYYATLNAKYPSDVFQMMENMQKGELGAGKFLQPLADKVRELGRDDVAEQIEEYIRQEVHHGEVLGELLAKYKQ